MISTLAALSGLADALARMVSVLEAPVLVGAVLALLVCALELGRFAAELWRRVRLGPDGLRALAARAVALPHEATVLAADAPSGVARRAVVELSAACASGRRPAVEHALADFELGVQRRLDRTRVLVRAGPALGLMGTLIPLAPGLAALGRGDVPALANDLRTAFAATVIGLLVGTVAFVLTLVRTRMYTEDLTALERAAEVVPEALAGGSP
jgi:biopolymer transport protein ExbB/TolQ